MKSILLLLIISFYSFSLCADDISDLKKQAEFGNSDAQFELANHYLNGNHVDYIEVLDLLRKSAKNGNNKAIILLRELSDLDSKPWGDYKLTPFYDMGIIDNSIKSIIVNAAESGHPDACVTLACSLFHEKEYTSSVKYLKLALKKIPSWDEFIDWNEKYIPHLGETSCSGVYYILMDAASLLGYCYEHGYGVNKDLRMAIAYYELPGGLSPSGVVVIQNHAIYKEINNPCLEELYGSSYDDLTPLPQAVRPGSRSALALIKLGMYEEAKVVLCEDLLGKSAGTTRSLWIGEMFYKGLGRPRDYEKAFEYFDYIVNKMTGPWGTDIYEEYPDVYADACYRLYECYAFGRGVAKNPSKAEEYYKLALRFGSSSAICDDQKRYEIVGN